jgi:hypothetical protein
MRLVALPIVLITFSTLIEALNQPNKWKRPAAIPLQSQCGYDTTNGVPIFLRNQTRRTILSSLLGTVTSVVASTSSASAGEVGARITKAVTQSDLGIVVRTSVVKGAQTMDQLDSQWEQFSDRFRLGAERSKLVNRPVPKLIPDPLPLDPATARAILDLADEVFLSLMTPVVKREILDLQTRKVAELVRPSFQRSKADLPLAGADEYSLMDIKTAAEFNFASYVHFKAYSDLILQQGKSFDFNTFRRAFESQAGRRLIALLLPQTAQLKGDKNKSEQLLNVKLDQIDQLCQQLKNRGLLSLTERSVLEPDQILDWIDDTSDLSFTVALDGDITLGSQLLLQEQGLRLYPAYARFAVMSIIQNIEGQEAQIEDYYFDTDYNSDPNKFDAKEVVLSVVLDSV